MEDKQVSFKTILSYGPDDNDEITVVIKGLNELNPKIEEIFNQKFDGIYFNDEFATYWAYDIPLAKGLTLDFNYYNDVDGIIYFDLIGDLNKLEEDVNDEDSKEDVEDSDNTEDDDTLREVTDDELHGRWITYLKSKINELCNSEGYYEMYWDYRDDFSPDQIQEIVDTAVKEDISVVAAANDYLWDLNSGEALDEYFTDDVREHVPDALHDYALDRDLYEDLEEAGYNGIDMNAQELLDRSEVKVNIIFATPSESNYDMSSIVDAFGSWKDPAYDYIVDNPEILDNAMTYLIHQQGHSLKEYYQCLLENPGGFGFDHKDTFIESCVNDCVNNTSDAMSGICCLTTLTPNELCELKKAINSGIGNLEFSKDTYCGTVNIWSGSGGLSVNLEKPLIIPVSYAHIVQVEGGKNNGYTVDEIFGLTGDCWDGTMIFTNSQPDLYKEDKEDLLNYIKTLVSEDKEED